MSGVDTAGGIWGRPGAGGGQGTRGSDGTGVKPQLCSTARGRLRQSSRRRVFRRDTNTQTQFIVDPSE
eukprot:1768693-Pyramimonas_sp.AAC.1